MQAEPLELAVRYVNGEQMLDQNARNGTFGALFVPTSQPRALGMRLGDPVRVVVRFERDPRKAFRVLGRVGWKRHQSIGALRAGVGVAFAPEDRASRDRLWDYALGREVHFVDRGDPRVLARVKVRYRNAGAFLSDWTEDLSGGGLFVRTDAPLPVGEVLTLRLRPPLSLRPLQLKGKVTWHRRVAGRGGMGVRFLYESAAQLERVQKMVERFAKAGRRRR